MIPNDDAREKSEEARLRRLAHRNGFRLCKSRARRWSDPTRGLYQILQGNVIKCGDPRSDYYTTLDSCAEFLDTQ